MSQIEHVGVFKGEVLESGLTLTKEKRLPQWVARLRATHKFVDTPAELTHFGLTEPAWVEWPGDQTTVAFLVLFNANADKGEQCVPGENDFQNYAQLKLALGWDGTEFDSLCGTALVGKALQFRIAENTYNDKTTLQVAWIDHVDADPVRQLKSLDAAGVKGLNKLLKVAKPAPKPVSAPKPPVAAAPTPQAAPVAKPPKPPKKAKAPEPEAPAETFPETTQMDGWKAVVAVKGAASDSDVETAWIESCGEVGGDRDEDSFTGLDWAKVRDKTIARLKV